MLIDSGSNKNLKNRNGETPLDIKRFFHYPPYAGDSEEAKVNEGYAHASQKGFPHESFFESEDLDHLDRSTDTGYASQGSFPT